MGRRVGSLDLASRYEVAQHETYIVFASERFIDLAASLEVDATRVALWPVLAAVPPR